MNFFRRLWGVFVFTSKRIFAQKGLTVAIILGFTFAVAIMMSIPIYSDAAYQKILERDVISADQQSDNRSITGADSTFSFMFRYIGSWNGLVPWERVIPVDDYLSSPAIEQLSLPINQLIRFFRTDFFPFVANQGEAYSGSEFRPLSWLSLASLTDWQDHVTIIEGSVPGSEAPAGDGEINVWVNEDLATEIGLQVGEKYRLLATFNDEKFKAEIPVNITGIWQVNDIEDRFWFYKPSEFRYVLLTKDEDFFDKAVPMISGELDLALWFMEMDSSGIHSRDVPSLLNRIASVRTRAGVILPNVRLDVSPEDRLRQYQVSSSSLMIFLIILNIPMLAMILSFIGLVGGMVVSQRQNEIAVLRSRGASIAQLLGFSLLESIIIGGISLFLGSYLALTISKFFSNVNSFLEFGAQSVITPSINAQAIQIGVLTIILGILALVIPTFNAARHTVITYKQEQARQLRPPWWQRAGLDFLLLIPALYGLYVLRQQGGLGIPVSSGLVVQDPFQNPLLMLVPALFIFSLTLIMLRILPIIMSIISKFLALFPSIGLLAATRHLARSTGNFHAPLILLVLTLSLSTFTATLAQTLDNHLHDQLYYSNGADAKLIEFGDMPGGTGLVSLAGDSNEDAFWVFIPVSEHMRAPGVLSAARVANSEISVSPPTGSRQARLMAIDRVDFSQSAFWRDDFASSSLGELMNQLALTTEGVLVPRSFLVEQKLKPGDILPASIYKLGNTRNIDFKIVGAFDLFPSWYPDEGILIVANLDYVFEQVGGEFPYEVWTRIENESNPKEIVESLEDLSFNISFASFSQAKIGEEQSKPERQGLFGLLSVGFTTLAFLTTIGFLLYAFFSFRRRFIELGILRAIGLSAFQMMILLGAELAFLLGLGLGAGTILGVLVSNLFIPYLQVGTQQTAHIPPFLVEIDWTSVFTIYGLFILLFGSALVVLSILLMRMKVFQAIKLGETV